MIVSEAGAAATVIDVAGLADVGVAIEAGGAVFGQRGRGFTVRDGLEVGIKVTATSGATIAGNFVTEIPLYGIETGGSGHRLEDNRVSGNSATNIRIDSSATALARNVAASAVVGIGIVGEGVTLSDDVIAGNATGIQILGEATLERVAVLGNSIVGIYVEDSALTLRGGRVVGNGVSNNCGIVLDQPTASLDASGAWFGAATGPGDDPADAICETGQSVVVEKNAKKPPKLKLKPQR